MLIMLACGALLALAAYAAWRWRGYALGAPSWARGELGLAGAFRVLGWLFGVGVVTGLLLGVLVVGPAGRLAMRLLAATSPDAQGLLTEADQVVGRITLEGTIGFFVFVGLPFGLVAGLAYVVASFVLPRGALGGLVFGAAVLVLFGSTIDPLREANPDFDLVGPGWLTVLTFGAMSLLTGVVAAPVAGRVAAALGAPSAWWLAWLLPLALLLVAALTAAPVALALSVVACGLLLAALCVPPDRRSAVWRRGRRALQAVLAVAVAVTAPGFVSAVSGIVG